MFDTRLTLGLTRYKTNEIVRPAAIDDSRYYINPCVVHVEVRFAREFVGVPMGIPLVYVMENSSMGSFK